MSKTIHSIKANQFKQAWKCKKSIQSLKHAWWINKAFEVRAEKTEWLH
jgi:hypothetical protein